MGNRGREKTKKQSGKEKKEKPKETTDKMQWKQNRRKSGMNGKRKKKS